MLWLLAIGLVAAAPQQRTLNPTPRRPAVLSRKPYVQLATPHSIVVVWRTLGASLPVVRYGRGPRHLTQTVPSSAIQVRVSPEQTTTQLAARLHSAPPRTYQYEATITLLHADTRYYYSVSDGERLLAGADPTHRFQTHPERGARRDIRIWVVGDSGTGKANQAKVHDAMLRFLKGSKPLDLYLHVGDMAYSDGTDSQFQTNFFQAYESTLRHTVCWPAMGNHEGNTSKGTTGIGPYYDAYVAPRSGEAGGLPSGTEAYYSFDYARTHFISLDSHDLDRRPTGAMARWLKADLEKTKAEWIVAFFHHPPYTKGSHDSDKESQLVEMRTHIMPILEAGGVDLVLTGHSHIYERSMLIDGAYATPTVAENVVLDDGDGDPHGEGAYKKSAGLHPHLGDIQIVTGNGGADLGRVGTSPIMKRVIVEHGSVLLDIQDDTLTAVMVNREGLQRDRVSLVKRGTVVPVRLANPRQLPAFTPPKATPPQPPAEAKLPVGAVDVIAKHDSWDYLAGLTPQGDWTQLDFATGDWKEGPAGFGYAGSDDITLLPTMKDNFTVVYLRHEFDIDPADEVAEFGLVINYDDAFIAYLNGHEVLRVGVAEGSGKEAKKFTAHDAKGYEYFPIKDFARFLRKSDNIIAIEGHNHAIGSSDFTLDPYVVMVKKPKPD